VRLINKLFTTPQYIEEKTFSGFTWDLTGINLKVLQTHSSNIPIISHTDEHGRNLQVSFE
jgi:thiamine pyrophosphokinase